MQSTAAVVLELHPHDRLESLRRLEHFRRVTLAQLEAELVGELRQRGYPWRDIAVTLGRSKTAVHRQYGGRS